MEKATKEEWRPFYEDRITKIGLPGRLFKFRCWNGTGNNSILTGPALWFASPATFNDPFDCQIPLRFDLMQPQDKIDRARYFTSQVNPGLSEIDLQRAAEAAVHENPAFSNDPETRKVAHDKLVGAMARTYGVLSMAGNRESVLMWSHYADSQTGYCVEFDAHSLAVSLFDILRTSELAINVYKVNYECKLPTVIPSNDDDEDEELHLELLTTKSAEWSYEEEFRFIAIGRTRFAQSVSGSIVKRVILGCRMLDAHRKEVYELVSDTLPHVRVEEAVTLPDKFGLDFKPWKPA